MCMTRTWRPTRRYTPLQVRTQQQARRGATRQPRQRTVSRRCGSEHKGGARGVAAHDDARRVRPHRQPPRRGAGAVDVRRSQLPWQLLVDVRLWHSPCALARVSCDALNARWHSARCEARVVMPLRRFVRNSNGRCARKRWKRRTGRRGGRQLEERERRRPAGGARRGAEQRDAVRDRGAAQRDGRGDARVARERRGQVQGEGAAARQVRRGGGVDVPAVERVSRDDHRCPRRAALHTRPASSQEQDAITSNQHTRHQS